MSSIHIFNKGDHIVRTERSHGDDGSYMGEEMIFLGILNNRIYIMFTCTRKTIFPNLKHDFNLSEWQDGWEYYVNPNILIDDDFLDNIDIDIIERYLRRKKIKILKNK